MSDGEDGFLFIGHPLASISVEGDPHASHSLSRLIAMPTPPRFFDNAAEWRAWLAEHGETATELVVGLVKTHTGQATMTWPQAVDEALCFGWIDGIRTRMAAWAFYEALPPSYRRKVNWLVISVKQAATRRKRFLALVAACDAGRRDNGSAGRRKSN